MSDYRFGDDYKLSIYPKEAIGYGGELDMDKVESVEIELVDFVRKPEDKSRWHELFGTPGRAAWTLSIMQRCKLGIIGNCDDCEMHDACMVRDGDFGALLEWLRGDA